MPAPLRVPYVAHFDFRALPSIRVLESFAHGAHAWAGVQNGIWPYDEYYWSERKGAWGGVEMPARETVANLSLQGASVETYEEADLDEPLLRVASGTTLVGSGEILYRTTNLKYLTVPDHPTEYRLYSCATGALTATAGENGNLGTVANGSYMLWARVFAGEYFNTGHGMAYRKDGEWSVVRVRVGAGAWSVTNGILPSPGAALYRKTRSAGEMVMSTGNEPGARVLFDPLARAVSASCLVEQEVRDSAGQFVIPKGSFLIGGLRSSRSGPQTALWTLHTDGTARLLGLNRNFSNGMCECGKTNHHASDIVQAPDGTIYVLTECALFRFDPDAATVDSALKGFPVRSDGEEDGHPGGNCLRFPSGQEMVHWTEDLTGRDKDEAHFYNRIVRRVSGRDVYGPSTLWHGSNCAEMYLGSFWAVRGERTGESLESESAALTGNLYLDWLDNGEWHKYGGMKRDMNETFWQRLASTNGHLFIFGFKPNAPLGLLTGHTDGTPLTDDEGEPLEEATTTAAGSQSTLDTPVCAISDGLQLRDATFPFFIRRATVAGDGNLFVAARGGDTGIGPANRVVEIDTEDGGSTRTCSFWSDSQKAFQMARADFESLGGDVSKLPAYFVWVPMAGVNGGGKWRAASVAPSTGNWLETSSTSSVIKFAAKPGGAIPYDVSQWQRFCFDILSDGSVDTENGPVINPTCTNAQCALESLPDGTKFRVVDNLVFDSTNPITAIQVTEASEDKRLSTARDLYPTLWMRLDSDAPLNDLSSYTRLVNYGRLIPLPKSARESVEVVVLVKPSDAPLKAHELHHVSRRS